MYEKLCRHDQFGSSLISVVPSVTDMHGVCRMPLIDKYRDMGTVVMGKIESGSVRRGDTLMIMPNKVSIVKTS